MPTAASPTRPDGQPSQYRLIPLVLVTFQFQFFYLYLMWRGVYFPDKSLLLIPMMIDGMAGIGWVVFIAPDVRWKEHWRRFIF